MLIDVRRRRLTEIDCLNGAVLRECQRHGIAAPLNRAMVDIVHAIEAQWQSERRLP
jgi:2-dehydropantoate 2-reductase